MRIQVHRLEIMVIDFDGLGAEGVAEELENTRFANDCISPEVKSIETREVDWTGDDHPLNKRDTADAEYRRLFAVQPPPKEEPHA